MLWGYALAFWDWIGLRLMFVGAALGLLALFVSLISAYVLYRVADTAQSELQSKTTTLSGEIERQKARAAAFEKETANAKLEQERLKADSVAMQAMNRPRRLSFVGWTNHPERVAAIYESLRKFAGHPS